MNFDKLQFVDTILKKYNLVDTEENFQRQIKSTEEYDPELEWTLSGDPATFEKSYLELKTFVRSSLDIHKYELNTILYPILVRMYLELIYNERSKQAVYFLTKFGPDQEPYFQNDLEKLATINSKELMKEQPLDGRFNLKNFLIPMSQRTSVLLKRFLTTRQEMLLLHIVEAYLKFDIYEETQRNEKVIGASNLIVQQAVRQYNKRKINCSVRNVPEDKSSEKDQWQEPNPKRAKELFEMENSDATTVQLANSISSKYMKINEEQEDSQKVGTEVLPTVITHTFISKKHVITCATVSEDSSMVAIGLQNNLVQVWSLSSEKLKLIKTLKNLKNMDLNAEDVSKRMMDDESGETVRTLIGHDGPINSLSFSTDGRLLLSCSEDGTMRLWNLLIWKCVSIYDTVFPVWDVKFSPHDYYFATASTDRTAKLWATKYKKPLRIFNGHFSDVDCIQFHSNSNYLATGSSDRRILLWDCITGNNVRIMMGHTSAIYSLVFSPCGRYLASGGSDFNVLIWDVTSGLLLKVLNAHKNKISALAFSRCGNFLASGSLDCTFKLWNFTKLLEDDEMKNFKIVDYYMLRSYTTKMLPIVALHFTKQKLLLSIN